MSDFIAVNDAEMALPAIGSVKVCQVKFQDEGVLIRYKVRSLVTNREEFGKRFFRYVEISKLLPVIVDAIACKGTYAGKGC